MLLLVVQAVVGFGDAVEFAVGLSTTKDTVHDSANTITLRMMFAVMDLGLCCYIVQKLTRV